MKTCAQNEYTFMAEDLKGVISETYPQIAHISRAKPPCCNSVKPTDTRVDKWNLAEIQLVDLEFTESRNKRFEILLVKQGGYEI